MIKKRLGKQKKTGKYMQYLVGGTCVLFVFACYQNMSSTGQAPAIEQIGNFIKEEVAVRAWKNCMPAMLQEDPGERNMSLERFLLDKIEGVYPILGFSDTVTEYDTQVESDLTEGLLAENSQKAQKEQEGKEVAEDGGITDTEEEGKEEEAQEGEEGSKKAKDKSGEGSKKKKKKKEKKEEQGSQEKTAKAVEIPREKLNDFDYLIQNFYQVDRTTTIDSSQLNAADMLSKDMKLKGGAEQVQILIYHTHSQEGYADSVPGDANTSVVSVGERLTALLQEKGFHVMHHTGEYDVADRDNAYSYAGPALAQILAENPSIEVVIDLHRDGVAETTHLVSEVNGKQTAQIMFFNGLSRTTARGDIAYLANPNLADNLAFSFQLKLAAEEYYPGFARGTYLKGYRYNLHYLPKSLLVEVGAQTNTLEEAMNAMEPLADILHKVLSPAPS